MFTCVCLGARLLLQSYQYPNLSEGADHVGGQLRGDKECRAFSGVTKSGRVWRKVPESDAGSVAQRISLTVHRDQQRCQPGLKGTRSRLKMTVQKANQGSK